MTVSLVSKVEKIALPPISSILREVELVHHNQLSQQQKLPFDQNQLPPANAYEYRFSNGTTNEKLTTSSSTDSLFLLSSISSGTSSLDGSSTTPNNKPSIPSISALNLPTSTNNLQQANNIPVSPIPSSDSPISNNATLTTNIMSVHPTTASTGRLIVVPTPRKYMCKTCNKFFTTSGHLARHSRIHTGERKHICPFPECNARFARHDNCMQHFRTHKNPKTRKRRQPKV